MTFESKKIIEHSEGTATGKTIARNIFQVIGMFCLWMGLVLWGIQAYTFFEEHAPSRWMNKLRDSTKTTLEKKDEQLTSIVNGLIVWVGGAGHRGAYNTDTMIVVSYNPTTKQLNLISLPRDLYVQIDWSYYGRINSILDYHLAKKDSSLSGALEKLSERVGNLIGQDIHYYGLIDFQGFEKVIDTLGGLKVNVPEALYDPTFPIDDFNYGVLSIDSGTQMMDGNTALNYARSRHSTSDFDRSKRQQIIIHSLIDKLLSFQSLSKVRTLYDNFKDTVLTNADITDILKYLPYISKIRSMNNVVFQSDCPENLNQMKPGCVLYSPGREAFGGAAVLLPRGATPQHVSNYVQLFQFVNRIIYHPYGDYKNINLGIYNSIDTDRITKPIWGFASQLWVELVRNNLKVNYVGNNNIKLDTNAIILHTGMKEKSFVEYVALLEEILDIGDIQILPASQLPLVYSGKSLTWIDMVLLIGNRSIWISGSGSY